MVQGHSDGTLDIRDLPPVEIIFGRSARMAGVRTKLERAAATNIPVLLQGESGTGKEIIAKLLHIRSNRARASWVKVICPAIPNTLIESELFGYERGAFTGAYTTKRGRVEQAHQGTLFLDEVGGLDMAVQAKLLQLLQDGSFMRVGAHEPRKINARFITSANGDLKRQIDNGNFRLDFYYRLNAVTIELPTLQERIEDLPDLIDYFFDLYARMLRADPKPFSRGVMRLMQRFSWPGNIRQLENMVRSYILIGDEDVLESELVPSASRDLTPEIDLAKPISLKEITKAATENLERQIILKVLQAHGGSRQKTAKWLNISYRSLLYKLEGARIAGLSNPTLRAKGNTDLRSRIHSAGPEAEAELHDSQWAADD